MRRGAVILCGGQSRRMGRDKASLMFGEETLLGRTIRIVEAVVPAKRIACVAAAKQTLPALPKQICVVRDEVPELGPLPALATGLRALESTCDALLVVSCDTPLLSLALLKQLFEQATMADLVLAELDGRLQPFPGVYRASVAPRAEALLAAGERSMRALIAEANCQRLVEEEVRLADPEVHSFLNCNNQQDLNQALAILRAKASSG